MFKTQDGYMGFLLMVDDVSNFAKAQPIRSESAREIATIIINEIILETGPPVQIRSDLGRSMDNEIARYIAQALHYELSFTSVQAHHNLKVERYIQTIQNILIANLRDKAHLWPLFLKPSLFAMNTQGTPCLQGYSPFEIHYKVPPPAMDKFQIENLTVPCSSFKDYLEQVKQRFAHIKQVITSYREKTQDTRLITTSRQSNAPVFSNGSLVYLLAPNKSQLWTHNRKIKLSYVGPFIVYALINQNNCLLMDLYGTLMRNVFHIRRLKPAYLRDKSGNVISTREQLQAFLRTSDDPTIAQLRSAIAGKRLEITGHDTRKLPALPAQTHFNMHTISPDNIPLQLYGPNDNTKHHPPETGNYSIIRSRFKNGDMQLLLSLSKQNTDRCKAFYINLSESADLLPLLVNSSITAIKRVGRPIINIQGTQMKVMGEISSANVRTSPGGIRLSHSDHTLKSPAESGFRTLVYPLITKTDHFYVSI
jgi:hypothetical protein